MTRYVFITGGVVSSLGKGIAAASLGCLLQARGYRVKLRKLDPYLNVDPGTMSPYQHGEVYVTDDGAETDLDLGHYERFTGVQATKLDNVTSGRIYSEVISRERQGDYLGATVQVIPHITDAIKDAIVRDAQVDFMIVEIGGTVGDIESLPFLEAIRQLGNELPDACMFLHLTLVPYLGSAGELKTKPTQHSVKELLHVGIQPDLLLCRCDRDISDSDCRKIAQFCNVKPDAVITALDVDSIYEVPIIYHSENLDYEVLKFFGLGEAAQAPDLTRWFDIAHAIRLPQGEVTIGVVGKYVGYRDCYKSLIEALQHGGIANQQRVHIKWLDSEEFEPDQLSDVSGVLVPGGFGYRGVPGKIEAVRCAREWNMPFFGICLGIQAAIIEAARNQLGITDASSTEFDPACTPVIGLLTEWARDGQIERREAGGQIGGTMRLGAYPAVLQPGSHAQRIYGSERIAERHRHRYEVNLNYRGMLEDVGLTFSGLSPDQVLPEIVERSDHPWFIAVQFHPELKSKPFAPHPLFVSFIEAAIAYESE